MTKRLLRLLRALLPPVLLPLALAGCPQQYPDPLASQSGDPECGMEALVNLIVGRAIDKREACGDIPVKSCGIIAAEVDERWKAKFDKWENCQ